MLQTFYNSIVSLSMHQWLDLPSLTSLSQTAELTTFALTLCYPNSAFSVEQCSQLFQTILDNLQNPVSSAKSKFYSLMILKELTERELWQFFMVLTKHRLFGYLFDLARMVDPDKNVNEKGFDLFEDSEQIGNKCMRLILEEIKYWANSFLSTSNGQPSQYKKAYDALMAKGVIFPQQQRFIGFTYERTTSITKELPPIYPNSFSTNKPYCPPRQSQKRQPVHQLHSSINQELDKAIIFIKGFIQKSINGDNANLASAVVNIKKVRKSFSLADSVQRFHEELSYKRDAYGELSDEILIENLNVIDKFYKINDFMNAQRMHYRSLSTKCDYASYLQQLAHSFEKVFQQELKVQQSNILVHNYPSNIIQNIPSFGINKKSTIAFRQSCQAQNNYPIVSNFNQSKVQINIRKSAGSIMDSNMFQKSSEIKNRFNGFHSFKKQLRQDVKQSRLDVKRTRSYQQAIKKTDFAKGRSNINIQRQSQKGFISNKPNSMRKTDSISMYGTSQKFSPIQNSNLRSNLRHFPFLGKQIEIDSRLFSTIYHLQKTEDIRKFRLANFKDRGLLFQNTHIQLGYETSTLYGNFGGFNTALKITLLISNKTDLFLDSFQIKDARKQSDRIRGETLVYTTPQQIPAMIPPRTQQKVQFVLVIINIPYSIPALKIGYNLATFPHSFTILLPCTFLKFVTFNTPSQRQLNVFYQENQGNLGHTVLRTEIFDMSSQISQLSKLIPQLQSLNLNHLTQRNTLAQCCKILLFNRFESILKFTTIRGESEMVIQAAFKEPLNEYKNWVIVLLQSLQFLLKS